MNCANCKYNDGKVYTSLPPKYKCTITDEFHEAYGDCNVDFVPVVRCKDCKWWDKKDGSPYGYCHACKHGHMSKCWEISIYRTYKGDWYCADGERKDDE